MSRPRARVRFVGAAVDATVDATVGTAVGTAVDAARHHPPAPSAADIASQRGNQAGFNADRAPRGPTPERGSSSNGFVITNGSGAVEQVEAQEMYGCLFEEVAIGFFLKAMTFVEGVEIPDFLAVGPHVAHDLLGFAHRHPGIVVSLGDEEGRSDLLRMTIRADRVEEGPHIRIPLVTVFCSA